MINNITEHIYPNVISLTLISNKSFHEQLLLVYLYSTINRNTIRNLIIQLDNCSEYFLLKLIEHFSRLNSLTISTYHSWMKLNQITFELLKSSIRSLNVFEIFHYFKQNNYIYQLFNQLETITINISTIEDCYHLLTLFFINKQENKIEQLRFLVIKCNFDQPDMIANWIRSNILRKLSYKCTTSSLTIWL